MIKFIEEKNNINKNMTPKLGVKNEVNKNMYNITHIIFALCKLK